MAFWAVDFVIEPNGREVEMEVEAETTKGAMVEALERLELAPGELLHEVWAHIGRPSAKSYGHIKSEDRT